MSSRVGNGGFKKKNRYNQEDGDVVFRILPPFSELNTLFPNLKLDNVDVWSQYYSVLWGYKNSEGKGRPFQSCEEVEWKDNVKTIKVADPALNRLNELKDKLAKAAEEGNGPLATKLKALVGMRGVYNIDKNHHMNVVDLQGNIGSLGIRHKAKLLLDAEIKKLEAEGIDPLSVDNGRYFVFTRLGTGNETSFKVSVYTEKTEALINGNKVMVDNPVVHKLTTEILSRLKAETVNLKKLFQTPTAEEVAQIVAESDILTGKSPACDRVFDARWKAERDSKTTKEDTAKYEDGPDADYVAPRTSAAAQAASAAPVAAPAQAAPVASAPPVAPLVTPVQQAAPAAKPAQAAAIEELSDDEFFKQLGVPATA